MQSDKEREIEIIVQRNTIYAINWLCVKKKYNKNTQHICCFLFEKFTDVTQLNYGIFFHDSWCVSVTTQGKKDLNQ